MNLATQLRKEREEKIIFHALDFAEEIEGELKESAASGYSGYEISLCRREDAHILKSPVFIESLKELLTGCEVEIRKDEYTNLLTNTIYYRSKLVISWKGDD